MGRLSILPVAVATIAIAICLTTGPISAKKCEHKAPSAAALKIGLDQHNMYRAKHKDTPALALDDSLTKGAQQCADMMIATGQSGHVCDRGQNGENLAGGTGNENRPPEAMFQQAVDMWYKEIANYSYANPEKPSGTVGHFTQVVWKNTQKLGLGVAVKGRRWLVVGRYNPPGNYVGQNGKNVMPLK